MRIRIRIRIQASKILHTDPDPDPDPDPGPGDKNIFKNLFFECHAFSQNKTNKGTVYSVNMVRKNIATYISHLAEFSLVQVLEPELA